MLKFLFKCVLINQVFFKKAHSNLDLQHAMTLSTSDSPHSIFSITLITFLHTNKLTFMLEVSLLSLEYKPCDGREHLVLVASVSLVPRIIPEHNTHTKYICK